MWPIRGANPWPTSWEADMLTTKPTQHILGCLDINPYKLITNSTAFYCDSSGRKRKLTTTGSAMRDRHANC